MEDREQASRVKLRWKIECGEGRKSDFEFDRFFLEKFLILQFTSLKRFHHIIFLTQFNPKISLKFLYSKIWR